eukprot:12893492-Prorocentrum_lima.AAC.1
MDSWREWWVSSRNTCGHVLHVSKIGEQCWPYAAMYVAVMRHRATHRLWSLPIFGEVVALTHPGPSKALDQRGQLERF